MRWLLAALVALLVTAPLSAHGALPPEAYEQLRQMAPVAFVGVVNGDVGGQASVRVEYVQRGPLVVGQVVTVVYPEDRGFPPIGAEVYYRRFTPGTRVRVFAIPVSAQAYRCVDGGIDAMAPAPRPAEPGGCASCNVGYAPATRSSASWSSAAALGILLIMVWSRRRRSVALGACLTACAPTPPGGPAGASSQEHEIASDGTSTVTVLSRPDASSSGTPLPAPTGPITDASCRASAACAERGACTATPSGCAAASYADCEQMSACAGGKCTFSGGACQAQTQCTGAHRCVTEGLCAEAGGACVASAEGCAASQLCVAEGRCSAADGLCVAASDSECKKSTACSEGGRCKADQGSCKVQNDGQCARTAACKEQGMCSARDGLCVKSCAESEACKRHGRCGERPSHAGSCVAVNDAHCEASEMCKAQGLCTMSLAARCEAGDDVECRLARACAEEGRCTAKQGKCVPASDAECANAALACKRDGRCKHDAGRCVKG
jgi:hypothetical protein